MKAWMYTLIVCSGCKGAMFLEDEQNYVFSSEISAGAQVVPPAADARVDWSGMTTDMYHCGALDPSTDLSGIKLTIFDDLTREEVLEKLNHDELRNSDLDGGGLFPDTTGTMTGLTSAMLSEFNFSGDLFDPVASVQEGSTYMLSLYTAGPTADLYRMLTFMEPQAGAPSADVSFEDDSSSLSYDVSITSSEPLDGATGADTLIDWSRLTTTQSGEALTLSDIDLMMVARYDETPEELEGNFLCLESLAEETYTASVSGKITLKLSELTDASGAAFTGFTDEGTWVLAMRCLTCLNPSPPFLALVAP